MLHAKRFDVMGEKENILSPRLDRRKFQTDE
jgi:hypothetical protein